VDLPIVILLDQWEHAYYLQYKTNRNAYIDAWWNVVNWDDAEKNAYKNTSKVSHTFFRQSVSALF